MPADTSVKVFHSGMTGAPTLSGTAGSLIAVLDACLLNGFGAAALDSLVVAGGVATATRAAGHPFEVGSVVEIDGAVVSGGAINGQHRVVTATSTSYTFEVTGLPSQTATGAATHRVAAAGWEKAFSATNLAVYRSLDASSTQMYLRVDDSNPNNARVLGYETMSDVNTGSGPFPTNSQLSGGLYWGKSGTSDSTSRVWILVADKKTLYYMPAASVSAPGQVHGNGVFGDIASAKPGDAFRCMINGDESATTSFSPGSSAANFDQGQNTAITTGAYAARSYSGIGSSAALSKGYALAVAPSAGGVYRSGASYAADHIPYPNPTDGGLYVTPFTVCEKTGVIYRGKLRGLFAFPQRVAGTFADRDRLRNLPGLPAGSEFMVIRSGTIGAFAFDVSGPWA